MPPRAIACLVVFPISLTLIVCGGAGSRDHSGNDERALLHRYDRLLAMGLNGLNNQLSQVVHLQLVPECQDHGLLRVRVAVQVDLREPQHSR